VVYVTIEPTGAPSPDLHLSGPAEPSPAETAGEVRYSVLSPRAIWTAAALILLIGVGVAVWLLLAYGRGGNELEAIKTAGTIVVGTGGAAALLLAARRQRSAEIALKQKDRDQAAVARAHALQERIAAETRTHQERVAAASELDAVARRITELYTKAADQLGSDKAPVRLAGLYALERLAQDNPSQRQTIANLLCAYLRMPYQLPGDPPDEDAEDGLVAGYHVRVQEREVRLTAQRLLTDHLRPGHNPEPAATHWADIDLDLTDATLIDFNLHDCRPRQATFRSATFTRRRQLHDGHLHRRRQLHVGHLHRHRRLHGGTFERGVPQAVTRVRSAETAETNTMGTG
jgi:hypothetical protein